ncbi:MAG: cell division protein SepF, partial [Coprococcus sp.]
ELEKNAPAYYTRQIENLLDTLIYAGMPLTLQEFAYLSGEGYISYRFLGLLDDLQAFISVTRSDRGNLYKVAHMQWEDEMKELHPEGAFQFRNRCSRLINEIEEGFTAVSDIIGKGFEGEYWLLMHLPSVYCRYHEEIMANQEEKLCMGSLERILTALVQDDHFRETFCSSFVQESGNGMLAADFREMIRDYNYCIELYKDMPCSNERGLYYTALRFYNPVMIELLKLYEYAIKKHENNMNSEQQLQLHMDIAWLKQNILLADDATESARQENLGNVLEEYQQIQKLVKNESLSMKINCTYAIAELSGDMGEMDEGIEIICMMIEYLKQHQDGNPLRSYQITRAFQLLSNLRAKDMLQRLGLYTDHLRENYRAVRKIKRDTDAEVLVDRIMNNESAESRNHIWDCYEQACSEYALAAQMKKITLQSAEHHFSGSDGDEDSLKDFKINVYIAVVEAVNRLNDIRTVTDEVKIGHFNDGTDHLSLIKQTVEDSLRFYHHKKQEMEETLPQDWIRTAAGCMAQEVLSDERRKFMTEAAVLLEHSIAASHGLGAASGIVYTDTAFALLPKKIRSRYMEACDTEYKTQFCQYLETCIRDERQPVISKEALCQVMEDYFRYIDTSPDNIDQILQYSQAAFSDGNSWDDYSRNFAEEWLEKGYIKVRRPILEACLSDKAGKCTVMSIESFRDVTGVWDRFIENEAVLLDIHLIRNNGYDDLQRTINFISGGCFSTLFSVRQLSEDYLLLQPKQVPEEWHLEDADLLAEMVLYQSDYRKVVTRTSADATVMLIKVADFYDAYEIAERLFNHQAVMMNMEDIDRDLAGRVLDFVVGACYCEGGSIQRLSSGIFMVSPGDITIKSEFDSRFEENQLSSPDHELPVADEAADFTLSCFDDIAQISKSIPLNQTVRLDLLHLSQEEKNRVRCFVKGVCIAMNGHVFDQGQQLNICLKRKESEDHKNIGPYICRPRISDDYEEACSMLLKGHTLIVNYECIDMESAQNVQDAISGCAWMLGCTWEQMGKATYIFSRE